VAASDAFGNVAIGYRGTVTFTSTDPEAVLPDDHAFTSADAGTHAFAVTLLPPGSTVTLTVRDLDNLTASLEEVLVS
jgi:hypothetical protein